MRTCLRLRALAPALALAAAAAALTPSAPARAEDAGPLGGPRLTGTAVVAGGAADQQPPAVSAASYVVADLDTGAVLAAKDPHGRYAPASTLKTLTAVTLIPRLDPARQVTPTDADMNIDGSKVGLVKQLSYSVKDLFTALLVVSANDAASTLAEAGGGPEQVAQLMNDEAAQLQADDTHAVNDSGLDADGQVSSAYDLALIARAGLALPDFRAYVTVKRTTVPAPGGATIEISNHDRLLGTYPGAIGVKNGFTEAARASFVGAATRNGHTLVVTLMRADPTVWKEAAALLDWGFAATNRSAQPVGRLADPRQPAPVPSAAAAAPGAEAPAVRTVAVVRTSGGWPVKRVTTLLLLVLLVLGGLRRRAVVRARVRRRRALAGVRAITQAGPRAEPGRRPQPARRS